MCFDRFSPIIALILTASRHETDDERTNNFGEGDSNLTKGTIILLLDNKLLPANSPEVPQVGLVVISKTHKNVKMWKWI